MSVYMVDKGYVDADQVNELTLTFSKRACETAAVDLVATSALAKGVPREVLPYPVRTGERSGWVFFCWRWAESA